MLLGGQPLAAVPIAASPRIYEQIAGTGAVTLGALAIAGVAERTVSGTGALTLGAIVISGTAGAGDFITGRTVYAGASVTTSTLGTTGPNISTLGTTGPNQTADEA